MARELKLRFPHCSVALLEKEADAAQHASGRSSGVLHAGFYYSEDSLKAKFSKAGNQAMTRYCEENGLKINKCGKLVVAENEEQLQILGELKRRADANGVDVIWVEEDRLHLIDPNAKTYQRALYSPSTSTVDPVEVCGHLKKEIAGYGVEFYFHCPYKGHKGDIVFAGSEKFQCRHVINTAGLHADRIAHDYGYGLDYVILPFKGMYLKYVKNNTDIATNIYPAPSRHNPFLGVHFTKTADDGIKIGPTAVPAFWRENYAGFHRFRFGEFFEVMRYMMKAYAADSFHFRSLAADEMKKYRKGKFIGLSMKLVKSIDRKGFGEYLRPGIRAQLIHKKTLDLIQDFVVEGDGHSIHVLNAVSPAFTCSFPFSRYVVDIISSGARREGLG